MTTTLAVLLLLLLLILAWQAGMRIRELAVLTAHRTCNARGVQFLDGSAALSSTRFGFSFSTGPCLLRTYTFDYSEDGVTRYTGCIIMRNYTVETVLMDG